MLSWLELIYNATYEHAVFWNIQILKADNAANSTFKYDKLEIKRHFKKKF